ncbi:cell wall-associated hydrolase, invasion-associated protein [Bernardetia litoralis DSM 6794]|uniref:Cell wall-associated hydrolase, invasion-associated protein n=1 Tax=Bernardetia litoralis (strain ATCC 23117 / DSM 6794 / NBRC 15988 / NCIMB 1366 / Fx l1 / Sio-4) TaxID=880071 RepID=I4AQV4_BERLS|nr:C40 family peptidase [Bernardetia litoralis]AFM06339.1 cell wall-associated hydrolase, invasion-associated protein [Bernardetia litoralis DSM 6794]
MDFKRTSVSFLCASLIFTCVAFTNGSSVTISKTDKITKKSKKKIHNRIISSNINSTSLAPLHTNSLLNCFSTPLVFFPPVHFSVAKDSITEISSENLADTPTKKENIQVLLDEEAKQKTNEENLELDAEEITTIDFSAPNNLAISPQLLEKIALREDFVTSVVDIAIEQEGVPYVYGGRSPKGFDCSGFVSYVYSQFNINLPASSSSYDHVGKRVKLEDAQVGDILCFTGRNSHSGRTGHVGIVVENNPNEPLKFIHAASGSRRKITYSTMESSYYKPRFRSARRISTPILEEILKDIESAE